MNLNALSIGRNITVMEVSSEICYIIDSFNKLHKKKITGRGPILF